MDKPQSFSEYLALSTADKMRLIRANEPLIRANESRTTTPPVADPQADLAEAVALLRECGEAMKEPPYAKQRNHREPQRHDGFGPRTSHTGRRNLRRAL